MADINVATFTGRLTRDAELAYTPGGMAICKFAVAINGKRKDGNDWVDEASFVDVTIFGNRGEGISKYLTKGKQVGISGRIKQERWTNKEGQNRSKIGIIANEITLLGGGEASEGGAKVDQRPTRPAAPPADDEYFEDEVPF